MSEVSRLSQLLKILRLSTGDWARELGYVSPNGKPPTPQTIRNWISNESTIPEWAMKQLRVKHYLNIDWWDIGTGEPILYKRPASTNYDNSKVESALSQTTTALDDMEKDLRILVDRFEKAKGTSIAGDDVGLKPFSTSLGTIPLPLHSVQDVSAAMALYQSCSGEVIEMARELDMQELLKNPEGMNNVISEWFKACMLYQLDPVAHKKENIVRFLRKTA